METQKNRGNKETDLKKDSVSKQDVNSQKRPADALGKKSSSSEERSSISRDEKESDEDRDLGRKTAADKHGKK